MKHREFASLIKSCCIIFIYILNAKVSGSQVSTNVIKDIIVESGILFQKRPGLSSQLHRLVYARHGRELMG